MLLRDLEDYKEPRRKPWLLLILLVVLTAIFVQRHRSERRCPPEKKPAHESSVRPSPKEYIPPTAEPPAIAPPAAVKEPSPAGPPPTSREPAVKPVPPAPPPRKRDDLGAQIGEAKALEKDGALVAAREKYMSLLRRTRDPRLGAEIEAAIGRLNIAIIVTPLPSPEKKEHIVKPGDFIQKIAKTYGTTVELLKKSNSIANPDVIRAGDRFVVFTARFSLSVSKKRNEMILWADKKFFKKYRIGTGKYDRTPSGTFMVSDKDKEPVWWKNGKAIAYTGDPDGENILGTRWMTLRATGDTPDVRGYGIHGTWEDDSIGKSESAGCIRMHNSDVEELFMLIPIDTPVTIVD